MLRLLHIENIAVIEQADILFEDGFNVLTGETGAGKSIVIDAISAILGERAYRDMIRTGKNKASVRAIFDRVPELAWFADNGVPFEQELTVRREIYLPGTQETSRDARDLPCAEFIKSIKYPMDNIGPLEGWPWIFNNI